MQCKAFKICKKFLQKKEKKQRREIELDLVSPGAINKEFVLSEGSSQERRKNLNDSLTIVDETQYFDGEPDCNMKTKEPNPMLCQALVSNVSNRL